MNAWPSLFRGLRAVSRGRLFIRTASAPTLPPVEESPEAEPTLEQTPRPIGIDTQELLALDKRVEMVLQSARHSGPKRY
jgi:hypothetical protein